MAESAGYSANKNECGGKQKAYRLKKIEESNSEGPFIHISVGKEAVEEYHTEYAEATDFVDCIYSFFGGQNITLFKKILKVNKKYINIYNNINKDILQDYTERRRKNEM